MKKILAIILSITLFMHCGASIVWADSSSEMDSVAAVLEEGLEEEEETLHFSGLNDPALQDYVSDEIYAELEGALHSDDYVIESIQTTYISKEYLDELAYNSQANVFFGYTLQELDEFFQGTKYVFTLAEDGRTAVKELEEFDDTYNQVLKNVAIGSGVILVCVTVSVLTAGAAPTISVIFAASAKTAAKFAVSSAVLGGVSAGVITGIQTKDFDTAIKAGALVGSEGFKWGAITGAVVGGVGKAINLENQPTPDINPDDTLIEPTPSEPPLRPGVNLRDVLKKSDNKDIVKDTDEVVKVPDWMVTHPTPEESELAALNKYGGEGQVPFLGGKRVLPSTPGSTKPDIIRIVNNRLEAIEVKNYNLASKSCLRNLYTELKRQVTARVENLPQGSLQRIVLDTRGRGFSEELVQGVIRAIKEHCNSIYPDIPVDIL